MAIDDSHVYWSDWIANKLHAVALAGGTTHLLADSLQRPFGVALDVLASMAGLNGFELAAHGSQFLWLIALAGAFAVFGPTSQRAAFELLIPRRALAWSLSGALVFMALQVGGGDNAEFIYFQF